MAYRSRVVFSERSRREVFAGRRSRSPPDSAEAAQVLNRILEPAPEMHPADREELIAGLEVTTDSRIERYWQLTATINGAARSRVTAADGGVASQSRRRLLPGLRAPVRLHVA
jgi:hypothetical protein